MTPRNGRPVKRVLGYRPRAARPSPGVVIVPRWIGAIHRTFVDDGDGCPSLFSAVYTAILFAIGACFRLFGVIFEESPEVRPGER